jgi:probable F420-dependent oxidoreductase
VKIGYWYYTLLDEGVGLLELARAIEERGFDSLFVGEHTHLPANDPQPMPGPDQVRTHSRLTDPLIALAVVAGATERLTLGTSVLLAAQREPIVTAKAIASLDAYSGGRVVLGVGTGWHEGEMRAHGVDPARRSAVLREHMLAMRAIWTQDEAEFHGEHVDVGPLHSWPKPPSGPVVLTGGGKKAAWRRIADYADGWLPIYGGDLDALVADVTDLRARAQELGRTLPVTVLDAPPEADALARLADAGVDRVLLSPPVTGSDAMLRGLDAHARLLS